MFTQQVMYLNQLYIVEDERSQKSLYVWRSRVPSPLLIFIVFSFSSGDSTGVQYLHEYC